MRRVCCNFYAHVRFHSLDPQLGVGVVVGYKRRRYAFNTRVLKTAKMSWILRVMAAHHLGSLKAQDLSRDASIAT